MALTAPTITSLPRTARPSGRFTERHETILPRAARSLRFSPSEDGYHPSINLKSREAGARGVPVHEYKVCFDMETPRFNYLLLNYFFPGRAGQRY